MAERVRITVAVDPEVLEEYRRMAALGNQSLAKTVGDWLADTADGAKFVSVKMAEAKRSPAKVMRELHETALGVAASVFKDEQARLAGARSLGRASAARKRGSA